MLKLANFIDAEQYSAKALFDGKEYVWQVMDALPEFMKLAYKSEVKGTVDPSAKLVGDGIFVDEGARVEAFTIVNGPCYIGKNSTVRPFTYVAGNVIIENDVTVGTYCHLRSSVIGPNTRVATHSMMGSSLIGANCFLGVGAKLLDISFTKRDLAITTTYEEYKTNRRELGALVGDRVRIGSGSVLAPCTHVGRNTIIYPLVSAFGVVPPNSTLSHEKPPIVKIRTTG